MITGWEVAIIIYGWAAAPTALLWMHITLTRNREQVLDYLSEKPSRVLLLAVKALVVGAAWPILTVVLYRKLTKRKAKREPKQGSL